MVCMDVAVTARSPPTSALLSIRAALMRMAWSSSASPMRLRAMATPTDSAPAPRPPRATAAAAAMVSALMVEVLSASMLRSPRLSTALPCT